MFMPDIRENTKESSMLGPAHSASGPAAFAASVYFIPSVAALTTGHSGTALATFAVGLIVSAGFALVPDFDTRGTAVRSLGVLGIGLMYVFRGISSVAIMIKGPRDNPDMDTHRSFTHTLVFAGLFYLLLRALMAAPFGVLAAQIVLALTAVIGLNGIFSKFAHKLRDGNPLGVYGVMALSLILVIVLWKFGVSDPEQITRVIPAAAAIGILAHLAGDIITKKGIPLLAPIPVRGKVWYSIRPLGSLVEAANPVANNIVYWGSVIATLFFTYQIVS